ncbi:ATP-grasp domain-containing protein [Photorhabdus australis]|uniref:ATP-grasp domain-containing protein n=1 Tax=Photorhabdus australis TaxID=286156 RepID=UPI001F3398B4|nr:ATP-grasp domain-containing protein [Photorhabdus australis]
MSLLTLIVHLNLICIIVNNGGGMNSTRYLLVLDYLPARIGEIANIRDYIRHNYSLELVIISDMLSGEEKDITPFVYHIPVRTENYVDSVMAVIAELKMTCAGILPFMDAVSGYAAVIAKKLNVYGDDPELSFAGIEKYQFRQQETQILPLLMAQRIKTPRYTFINDIKELEEFYDSVPYGVIIKPNCGRANLGVVAVKDRSKISAAFAQSVAQSGGNQILAEELITFDTEYSYDGIGCMAFLTQKVSQKGEFPVEIGQIVPAQCDGRNVIALHKAGQAMNLISGQILGAFHNEIKQDSETGETFLVETNRRPAGMRIWDMANRVYGISLQEIWVDHLVKGFSDQMVLPKAKGRAFLINLLARKSGKINDNFDKTEVSDILLASVNNILNKLDYEIIAVKINLDKHSYVYETPKSNNDFCGYVCVHINDEHIECESLMNEINDDWQGILANYIS